MTNHDDTQHCPLCGEVNLCAIALNSEAGDCWCRHTTIKPELIAQTAQLNHTIKSCICQRCAQRALTLGTELKETP